MKAPNARDRPRELLKRAIPRHKTRSERRKSSREFEFAAFARAHGTSLIEPMKTANRKNAAFADEVITPRKLVSFACNIGKNGMIATRHRSCTRDNGIKICPWKDSCSPRSINTFDITTLLEIAQTQPKSKPAAGFVAKPVWLAISHAEPIVKIICNNPALTIFLADAKTRFSERSTPRAKRSIATPNSESTLMVSA